MKMNEVGGSPRYLYPLVKLIFPNTVTYFLSLTMSFLNQMFVFKRSLSYEAYRIRCALSDKRYSRNPLSCPVNRIFYHRDALFVAIFVMPVLPLAYVLSHCITAT